MIKRCVYVANDRDDAHQFHSKSHEGTFASPDFVADVSLLLYARSSRVRVRASDLKT